jgi:hypothetical protein
MKGQQETADEKGRYPVNRLLSQHRIQLIHAEHEN